LPGALCSALTCDTLLLTVAQQGASLSDVNACTAFHRLSKLGLVLSESARSRLLADPRLAALAQALPPRLLRLSPRSLSALVWAHAKLGHGPEGLLELCAPTILAQAGRLAPQDLSTVAWSYATLCGRDDPAIERYAAPLVRGLAPHVRAAVRSQQLQLPQQLSMLLWSYATLGVADEDMLTALQSCAEPQLNAFTPQGLSNLAWGFARLNHAPQHLMLAIGDAYAAHPRTSALDASSLAYALATAGVRHEPLLKRVRAIVLQRGPSGDHAPSMGARELAGVAWSLATLRPAGDSFECDVQLWGALASALTACAAGLTPQGVSNVAWAFAVARYDAPGLFAALERVSVPRISSFTSHALATLAYALGAADVAAPGLAAALLRELAERLGEPPEVDGKDLCSAAWGLAVAGADTQCGAFRRLRSELAQRCERGDLERVALAQLYQVEQLADLQARRRGGGAPWRHADGQAAREGAHERAHALLGRLHAHGSARAAARVAWALTLRGQEGQAAPSALQASVWRAAQELRAREWPAAPAPRGEHVALDLYTLDLAWPTLRLAIEVDGPAHFMGNTRRFEGATRVKRTLLADAGWTVVSVPYFDWDGRSGARELMWDYLRSALRQAGALQLLQGEAAEKAAVPPQAPESPAERAAPAMPEAPPPPHVMAARSDLLALARARGGGAGAALRGVLAARVRRAS